jgi:hypothetical protein
VYVLIAQLVDRDLIDRPRAEQLMECNEEDITFAAGCLQEDEAWSFNSLFQAQLPAQLPQVRIQPI